MKLPILFLSLFLSFYTNAQFFYQDPDYGNNKIISYDSLGFNCFTQDSLGNFYIAGNKMASPNGVFSILKTNSEGERDSTFGINGVTSFDMGGFSQVINDIKVQPDGKIVFVGEYYMIPSRDGIIGRFTADGQWDTTFNGTGYRVFDGNNQYDSFLALDLQSDGKYIAAGYSCFGGQSDWKIAAVRYNNDGTLDSSFADNGLFRHTTNGQVNKILLDNDKILLTGAIEFFNYYYASVLVLDTTGTIYSAPGGFDLFNLPDPSLSAMMDIIKDGNGYISMIWQSGPFVYSQNVAKLLRLTQGGTIDQNLFGGGVNIQSIAGYSIPTLDMVKVNNTVFIIGNIDVTGGSSPANSDAYLMQVDISTGNRITTNGNNGVLTYTEPGALESFNFIILLPDGDLLVGGNSSLYPNRHGFLTKYSNAAKVTSITPDMDVCAGNAINLTASALGHISGYQWRKNGVNLTNGANISGATSSSLTISNAGPSDAGNYDLVAYGVTSPPDTSAVAQVTISTAVPATPGAISGPAVVCRSFKYNYSIAPVTGADSYVWSLPPGTQILSGAGTTSVSVQFSNTAGNISVHAQNGCGSSQATWLPIQLKRCATHNNNVNSPLRNTNSFTRFEIFPNPASSELNIHFISEIEQPVNIRLFDAIGRMEFDKNIISEIGFNTNELDLSTLISGIYILEIVMGEEIIREKIVLNRQ